MRRAGGLVVALLILGLAAAGLISAQKNVTHLSSAGAVSDSLAASGPPAIEAASQRAPVSAASELPRSGATHFGATTRVAEATGYAGRQDAKVARRKDCDVTHRHVVAALERYRLVSGAGGIGTRQALFGHLASTEFTAADQARPKNRDVVDAFAPD